MILHMHLAHQKSATENSILYPSASSSKQSKNNPTTFSSHACHGAALLEKINGQKKKKINWRTSGNRKRVTGEMQQVAHLHFSSHIIVFPKERQHSCAMPARMHQLMDRMKDAGFSKDSQLLLGRKALERSHAKGQAGVQPRQVFRIRQIWIINHNF